MWYFDGMKENKHMQSETGRGLKGESNMSNHALKEFVVGSGTSTQRSTVSHCQVFQQIISMRVAETRRRKKVMRKSRGHTVQNVFQLTPVFSLLCFLFLTLIHSWENSLFCCQGMVINFPCRYQNIRAHTSTLFLISTNLFICLMLKVM